LHDDIIRGKGIAIGTVNMSCECDVSCSAYRVLSETVGQFTGLKDKNGNEIYEGDIIDFGYHPNFSNKKNIGDVIWVDNGYWAINVRNTVEYHIVTAVRYGKIIGNIHDNKDLFTLNQL
jgi:uncharacterized phage protein (TIGR01671 family)